MSNTKNRDGKPKRKGVWAEIHTFEHPESGLVCIITERVRGAVAYSFQIGHTDDKGFNKFIPCPVPGTIDVEHIVKSLAESARTFIEQKIAENVRKKEEQQNEKRKGDDDRKNDGDRKGTRRGGRGRGKDKRKGGLSTLAREDAQAGGHDYVGPTKRRKEKRRAAS